MKRCKGCGQAKLLNQFYPLPLNRDGHTGKCKECIRAGVTANRQARALQYQQYEAGRLDDPKRKALRRRVREARRHDQEKAMADTASKFRWIERNPTKRAALIVTGNAIRDGDLARPTACTRCGTAGELVAHHQDFNQPLLVTWICHLCHGWLLRGREYEPRRATG